MKNRKPLKANVQMFGDFHLTMNGITISSDSLHINKPWLLLEYLITCHGQAILPEQLNELIQADKESVNPGGALKTLVFRCRKLLEPFGLSTALLILQRSGGSYEWNPEIELDLDTDHFTEFCEKAADPDISPEEKRSLLIQAVEIYQGDFLARSALETWILPLNVRYHNMYLQAAHEVLELLTADQNWEQVIYISKKALGIKPYDEEFHYSLIYALYRNGQTREALEHYQDMTSCFYNEFAITPSARLKELYKLIQNNDHGVAADLSDIRNSLEELHDENGAYFCEYAVFRDVYQLEQRAIERTGDSIFLCLITLQDETGELPKNSILTRGMGHLLTAIRSSLRRGDVCTRYSVSQYLILLPSASYENGMSVMHRIEVAFKKLYPRKDLALRIFLQAIEPKK